MVRYTDITLFILNENKIFDPHHIKKSKKHPLKNGTVFKIEGKRYAYNQEFAFYLKNWKPHIWTELTLPRKLNLHEISRSFVSLYQLIRPQKHGILFFEEPKDEKTISKPITTKDQYNLARFGKVTPLSLKSTIDSKQYKMAVRSQKFGKIALLMNRRVILWIVLAIVAVIVIFVLTKGGI